VGSTAGLQGILFLNKEKRLHLYATDLSTFFHTSIVSSQDTECRFLLDTRKVVEFLSYLSPGDITAHVEKDKITILQKKTKGSFPFMPGTDFPTPPKMENETQKIEVKTFEKIISLVLFSASKDLSRPVLSGINFVEKDGEMDVVSTDGFRLSLLHTSNDINLKASLVPAEFLLELSRNIKEKKEIQMSYLDKEKMVFFKTGEEEYFTRLIEGDFPPYERVIPKEKKTTVSIDREELVRNVKLISVFARDFSNIVVCLFDKNGLTLSPKTEGGAENSTTQDCEFEGEEMRVAFNFKFLLDFLNSTKDEKIIIELLRPDAPVVLKTSEKGYTHIIMPVRIQE
jgi:DNA polymerase-3 subunit beta